MLLQDCLKYVVGLSRSECECFDTDRPVDYNTSESGLYIADCIPLNITNSATDCEKGGIWDIMETARERAINTFLADLPPTLAMYFGQTLVPYLGYVGSPRFNDATSPRTVGNYAGQLFKPNQIKGGKVILRGVELALTNFTPPVNVDVFVYSNLDLTTPLGSTTVTLTTTNKMYSADFSSPIELIMDDKDANGYSYPNGYLEYYIVYQVPTGAKYVNNQLYDGGGGCSSCNKSANQNRQFPFLPYGNFNGIESPSIAALETPVIKTDTAQGLRIKGDFGCAVLDWLCGLTYDVTSLGAGNHADVAAAVAKAIYWKSVDYVIGAILSSKNINSITVLNREQLYGKKATASKTEYPHYLGWLAQNIPTDLTDCYTCKESTRVVNIR